MSLFLPGRVVVFDYGEVISRTPHASRDALVDATGIPADELFPVYQELRHDLDRGDLSVVAYWRAIAERTGRSWSVAEIHRFWAIDFTGWFEVEPETLAIVEELHDAGTRLALLSNAGFDFGDPYRRSPMGSLFETVVVSAEEHVLKPAPSIYRDTCTRLGIDAGQMVFVDNRAENAAGAEAIGAVGHHYTSPDGLRTFLQDLSQQPAPAPVP
ncbi:putative hydrolase of the HAD superfamily [Curtobacterium flaccumfaciens]|uniref:Putative hydrolase of the HAD superfamily n=1 Tax=Curtobacterium flaccumfaciens TaxID=2035 RepID=A0A4R6DJL3_9MICO|nr:HAD family phosphatase [Curtobacterium flaccumfaciens]TDN44890.1 putative hydrolase of the HAD superfamily [Curtobacterium flaccumfaciens]